MAHYLKSLIALSEDPHLISSYHMVATNRVCRKIQLELWASSHLASLRAQ